MNLQTIQRRRLGKGSTFFGGNNFSGLNFHKTLLIFLGVFFAIFNISASEISPIPFCEDPPIMVDGLPDDWKGIACGFDLNTPAHVTWKNDTEWKGKMDFSGTIKLCWKPGMLYVMAEVKDDNLQQEEKGGNLWKGDHLMLYIDMIPGISNNEKWGKGQYQIGISPGNFEDIKPEVYCFHPERKTIFEAACAASRTPNGWVVEAAIPWKYMGNDTVKRNQRVDFEVMLSDSDIGDTGQCLVMTSLTDPWKLSRMRLRKGCLASSSGEFTATDIQAKTVLDGKMQFSSLPQKAERVPAPHGKLELIGPKPLEQECEIIQNSIPLVLKNNKRNWTVSSRFSTPDGKWTTKSNAYFTHSRLVEKNSFGVEVIDTFTNLTDNALPLMQEHEIKIDGKNPIFYINGLKMQPITGGLHGRNCTSYGGSESGGIGIVPLNVEFQIHSQNYVEENNIIGLCDRQTVIPPQKTISQRFMLVPTEHANYWDFINRSRKRMDANFEIRGPMTLFFHAADQGWTLERLEKQIRFRNAKMVCFNNPAQILNGKYLSGDGTVFKYMGGVNFFNNDSDYEKIINWIEKLRSLKNKPLIFQYFHDQLSSAGEEKYIKDDHVLYKNGRKAKYFSAKTSNLYLPLNTNTYGRVTKESLMKIIEHLKPDGIFWDEFSFAGTAWHYGEPWDNCSGDIDPRTHKLIRKKSSVTLLKMPWQINIIKELYSRGISIIANGYVYGEVCKFKIPTVNETAKIENCARTHLWTPIQLEDYQNNDIKYLDCYRRMLQGLDYGCVYYWWFVQPVKLTEPSFTTYMFPITPIELHKGYIIGEERIITKVSGLFGWGDKSSHEIKVYDEFGSEVKDHGMKTQIINEKTYSEIRLPGEWSAVIIRKK